MQCSVKSAYQLEGQQSTTLRRSAAFKNAVHSRSAGGHSRSGRGLRSVRSAVGVVRAALVPSETNILVAGGAGVAMKTAQRLLDASSTVFLLQRSDVRSEEISAMGATMVVADVLQTDQVSKAFAGLDRVDVVVSSVGGTPADPVVDSQGNINLIDAALEKGVKRFVLVTSIGVADSKDAIAPIVYETLEPVLVEKAKAEQHLKGCGDRMEYVIIRPGGLKSEEATGDGILTEDITVGGAIQREDVATLVAKCIFSDKTKNKVLSALDKNQLFREPVFEEFEA